jgi:hypothetical protein
MSDDIFLTCRVRGANHGYDLEHGGVGRNLVDLEEIVDGVVVSRLAREFFDEKDFGFQLGV